MSYGVTPLHMHIDLFCGFWSGMFPPPPPPPKLISLFSLRAKLWIWSYNLTHSIRGQVNIIFALLWSHEQVHKQTTSATPVHRTVNATRNKAGSHQLHQGCNHVSYAWRKNGEALLCSIQTALPLQKSGTLITYHDDDRIKGALF